MLSPEVVSSAAQTADYHIQLEIQDVNITAGEALLSGPIVRIFRGPPSLERQHMQLRVSCVGTDNDGPLKPSGYRRYPASSLKSGRVFEAYVVQSDSGHHIAANLCALLDAPTEQPRVEPPR